MAAGALDVGHELGTGALVTAEDAKHGAGGHTAAVFLDAADHGAHVDAVHHDGDASGLEHFMDKLGDLAGHALLYLKALGEHIDDARDLAESDDFAVGDVGDVGDISF